MASRMSQQVGRCFPLDSTFYAPKRHEHVHNSIFICGLPFEWITSQQQQQLLWTMEDGGGGGSCWSRGRIKKQIVPLILYTSKRNKKEKKEKAHAILTTENILSIRRTVASWLLFFVPHNNFFLIPRCLSSSLSCASQAICGNTISPIKLVWWRSLRRNKNWFHVRYFINFPAESVEIITDSRQQRIPFLIDINRNDVKTVEYYILYSFFRGLCIGLV